MCPLPLLQPERNSKAYPPLGERNSNLMNITLKALRKGE